jgi:rSAM/selenodomain-associated transferase 2
MISIIIPTLNEAERLPKLLAQLTSELVDKEIIVVDGGSDDGTAAIATSGGARAMASRRGRGPQLELGARAARGDILLFLHADSVFPRGGLQAIEQALESQSDAIGGNFRLIFEGDAFSTWLTGFYAWLRRRGLYYGDSGIFVRRRVCDALGGVRPFEVMEDYDLVRRLERSGRTICIADPPLRTSSRRFVGRHPVAIVVGWLWVHALFLIGLSPRALDWIYDSARSRRPH